jgi:alkylhydroperoxidase family enzyme
VTQKVLADLATAPIAEPLRATLRFLGKLTLHPTKITVQDALSATAAGVSADALREALYVCALFNTIDRIADALDFSLDKPDGSKALIRFGYKL